MSRNLLLFEDALNVEEHLPHLEEDEVHNTLPVVEEEVVVQEDVEDSNALIVYDIGHHLCMDVDVEVDRDGNAKNNGGALEAPVQHMKQ
ncbi:hypothetical protein EJ110_NYTH22468 [Nymphaea thermarum]|nr:hypothetical protein EJ110_NYTH22468 [Nymphaea thermarum]